MICILNSLKNEKFIIIKILFKNIYQKYLNKISINFINWFSELIFIKIKKNISYYASKIFN